MPFQLNGGFPIILTDVPWAYSNAQDNDPARGGTPYKQMSMDDLCGLAPLIDKIAAKDCLMFQWCTYPKLAEGLRLMDALGFQYTTIAFTWIKLNPTGHVWQPKETHILMNSASEEGFTIKPNDVLLKGGLKSGMGYYTNANAEIVMLGRRGKVSQFRADKAIKQVVFDEGETIITPMGGHSAKPEEVRQRIMQLTGGNLPGLELFARGEKVKGWKKLGYEIDGKDITTALEDLIG